MKSTEDKIIDLEYEVEEYKKEIQEIELKIASINKNIQRLYEYQNLPEKYVAMTWQHVAIGKFKTAREAQAHLDRCDMSGYVLEDEQ